MHLCLTVVSAAAEHDRQVQVAQNIADHVDCIIFIEPRYIGPVISSLC